MTTDPFAHRDIEHHKRETERYQALFQSYIDRTNKSKTDVPEYLHKILVDAKAKEYRVWPTRWDNEDLSHPFMLQKRIRKNDGSGTTLYFVNLEFWDLGREFSHRPKTDGIMISPEAQFTRQGRHVNVKVFVKHDEETLESIEKFFEDFFTKMECRPYDDDEG